MQTTNDESLSNQIVLPRQAILCSLALLTAGLCSCTSGLQMAAVPPLVHEHNTMNTAEAAPPLPSPSIPPPQQERPSVGTETVRQVAHSNPHVSADSGPAHARIADRPDPVEFTPSESRVPLPEGPAAPGEPFGGVPHAASAPPQHRDEYLCDGGDRFPPVHYDRFHRHGLDTEDAVVEYVDHLGEFHVRPTNRVCVYAPRFAAVRSVSVPHADTSIDRLASTLEATHGSGLRQRVSPTQHSQRDGTDRMRVRSRAGGLGAEAIQVGVDQHTAVATHMELLNAYEDLTFVRTGHFVRTESARLAEAMQAAALWTRDLYPVIVAQSDMAQEVIGEFRPEELIGSEDQRTPGDLRIVKLADKKAAAPGEVITFTIRYDNVGDRELHHVRIIDNLTPRLELIDGSETSDREGQLILEDNDEGSLVLQFELDDPLPGRFDEPNRGQVKGGVLTFQARVR